MKHGHRNKKDRLANEINVAWLIVLPNLENCFHQIGRFPVLGPLGVIFLMHYLYDFISLLIPPALNESGSRKHDFGASSGKLLMAAAFQQPDTLAVTKWALTKWAKSRQSQASPRPNNRWKIMGPSEKFFISFDMLNF